MWCLSKTRCKFTSGFYWLHFGKTNSTNRSTWTSVISMRSLVNEEEECMITIWYWERIVIFASGFVNLFNLERSLKLCQKHLAAKGVALGISSSPLLIRVERAGGRRWRKWTDSLFTSLWFSEKKIIKISDVRFDRSPCYESMSLRKPWTVRYCKMIKITQTTSKFLADCILIFYAQADKISILHQTIIFINCD